MISCDSLRKRGGLFAVAVGALLGIGCHAKKPSSDQPGASASRAAQQTAPSVSPANALPSAAAPATESGPDDDRTEAWIQVSEGGRWIPVVDDLGARLLAAVEALKSKNEALGAKELRSAATTLTEESATLPPEHKGALSRPIKDLGEAASKLENGRLDTRAALQVIDEAYRADLEHRWVFVGVDEWFRYYKRPDVHFERARAAIGTNPRLAADEIRKANSYMELVAAWTPGSAREGLLDSITSLAALADKVGSGTVKDPAVIDDAVVASSEALGEAHYQNAVHAWEKKDQELSARSLEASIHHMRQALTGADEKFSADTEAALRAAHHFASAIKKDTKVEEADMQKHMKAVERAVAEVEAKLKTKRAPSQK